jgi:hypothetical protein
MIIAAAIEDQKFCLPMPFLRVLPAYAGRGNRPVGLNLAKKISINDRIQETGLGF